MTPRTRTAAACRRRARWADRRRRVRRRGSDVLELPRDLHEAVQVPVDAHDGVPGLAGRRGRIGEVRYGVVVDLQLAVARGQLEAAPGALRSVERLPGHDATIRLLLAGQRVDTRDLPCARLHVVGRDVAPHALAAHVVLAQESDGADVVVALRADTPVRAVRHGRPLERAVRTIAEMRLLGGRFVCRQIGRRQRAVLAAAGHREPRAQALERAVPVLERQREDAREDVLAALVVEVGVAAVDHAVEDADGVRHPLAGDVAEDARAQIAVRRDVGRRAAFDEGQLRRRLQPLEAELRLVLADAQLQPRRKPCVSIGVVEHGLAPAEVGHQLEVEDLECGRFQHRTDPAKHEGRRPARRVVVSHETAVGLDVAPEFHLEVAVGRLQRVAVPAGRDSRRHFGLFSGLLSFDLELALQDAELLIQLLDLRGERVDLTWRIGGRLLGRGTGRQKQSHHKPGGGPPESRRTHWDVLRM